MSDVPSSACLGWWSLAFLHLFGGVEGLGLPRNRIAANLSGIVWDEVGKLYDNIEEEAANDRNTLAA